MKTFRVITSDGKEHTVNVPAGDVVKFGPRLAIWWRMGGYGYTYTRWDIISWMEL